MSIDSAFKNLVSCLDDEVKVYRHLLDVVRREHEVLLRSNLDELLENNEAKEAMVQKLQKLERQRQKRARDLGKHLDLYVEAPRLLELASKLEMKKADRLRTIHTTLNILVKRVKEGNAKNEVLVNSALSNIRGALESLKTSLEDKGTYKGSGQASSGKAAPGKLVSKEI